VLLAYVMLINPAMVQDTAQEAIDYSNLTTDNWGTAWHRQLHQQG